ncbi:hypothetical protein ASPWEDRAFT_174725 [Aspergillus wentii DTO 134E9]|uniref:Homeobox domain-containing protein n=1 Tax=Aspergillus wentii DTO 134E9 TaxID=1073089 RepID=A0A1L9REI0_ASPWE|nr:uncharacterized protein ASPWEDRAFT_174725 [Aspergillus wentii DTO 134E9]OJJ33315.1 hypothetical protein ASPWEDRAFT_174725 [Aspergillus wentii DTO 134E9]
MEGHHGFDQRHPPPEDPQNPAFEAVADGNLSNLSNEWSRNVDVNFDWDVLNDTYHPFVDFQNGEWPHLTIPDDPSFYQNLPTSAVPDQTQYSQNLMNDDIGNPQYLSHNSQAAVYPDFNNVSQWLDGAYSPPKPCSYCRRHRLQCLIIRTAPANPNPITSCSSCVALFRECSLARGEKRQPSGFETMSPVFGNLHGLAEDVDDVVGQVEGSRGVVGPEEDRKESKQFVRKGARVLRDWYRQHQEYPYPSEGEKSALANETGFSKQRVSTWFANARRRQKQKLQSSRPPTQVFRSGSPMPSMTPMERWQASPPEDEAVPESAIQNAIATSGPGVDMSSSLSEANDFNYLFNLDESSSHLDSSLPSVGSRQSEASSDSQSSAWSHNSAGEGGLPFPSLPKRTRLRHRRGRQRRTTEEGPYQCTFCTQSFQKKHDWSRHEKTVHLSLESWVCTPDLLNLQSLAPTSAECRFCETTSPSQAHWEDHEFKVCAAKPIEERSFTRKDYLWQHLKKFHGCTKLPVARLESWRCEANNVSSRCGFCEATLPNWSTRMDHLAGHFKQGLRMTQWEGDWGLEPSVLAYLRNAALPSERMMAAGLSGAT